MRILTSPFAITNNFTVTNNYGGPIGCVSNRYGTHDFIVGENTGKKGYASNNGTTAIYSPPSNKIVSATAYSRTLDYFMFGG